MLCRVRDTQASNQPNSVSYQQGRIVTDVVYVRHCNGERSEAEAIQSRAKILDCFVGFASSQ
jgi:hypothetical protein